MCTAKRLELLRQAVEFINASSKSIADGNAAFAKAVQLKDTNPEAANRFAQRAQEHYAIAREQKKQASEIIKNYRNCYIPTWWDRVIKFFK